MELNSGSLPLRLTFQRKPQREVNEAGPEEQVSPLAVHIGVSAVRNVCQQHGQSRALGTRNPYCDQSLGAARQLVGATEV